MRRNNSSRRRFCWASQLPAANDRLADAVERVRSRFFSAQVLIAIPSTGELLAVEVAEHGRRLQVRGRRGAVTVPGVVFWRLAAAARRADSP